MACQGSPENESNYMYLEEIFCLIIVVLIGSYRKKLILAYSTGLRGIRANKDLRKRNLHSSWQFLPSTTSIRYPPASNGGWSWYKDLYTFVATQDSITEPEEAIDSVFSPSHSGDTLGECREEDIFPESWLTITTFNKDLPQRVINIEVYGNRDE